MQDITLDLSRLTDQEREEYHRLKHYFARDNAELSLSEFVRQAWHVVEPSAPYVHGWHVDAICEHLEAARRRQIRKLLITIPPRHTKSTLVSVMFPAWVWATSPGEKFLFASHAHSLSVRDSVGCRRLIQSDWYRRQFGIKWDIVEDQNTKLRYDNTMGGHRIATSVGGSSIGEGGSFRCVDDAHKPLEVYSDTIRQGVLDWLDQEFAPRAIDPKSDVQIIIMQRLHEMDVAGHVLAKGGWDHLCLPAEYDPSRKRSHTVLGWEDPRTKAGELLWPARVGPVELAELKKDLGDAASGQLDQDPVPAKGLVVQKDWFRFYRRGDMPEFDFMAQSWDLIFEKSPKSDFVAGQVWGRKGPDKYLVHRVNERMSFDAQLDAFVEMTKAYPRCNAKWIEKAANGAALISILQKHIPGLIAVLPMGSKSMRAQAVAPQFKAGNIWLPHPDECPWVLEYINQWLKFPKGAHDDEVDATSQALMEFSKMPVFDFKVISVTGASKWLR